MSAKYKYRYFKICVYIYVAYAGLRMSPHWDSHDDIHSAVENEDNIHASHLDGLERCRLGRCRHPKFEVELYRGVGVFPGHPRPQILTRIIHGVALYAGIYGMSQAIKKSLYNCDLEVLSCTVTRMDVCQHDCAMLWTVQIVRVCSAVHGRVTASHYKESFLFNNLSAPSCLITMIIFQMQLI